MDGASLDAARSMAHGQQLARIAHKYPDRVALVCREERRTMAELDQRVSRLAASLARRGLKRGDRLAVLMGNSIEMVEAVFAGWRLGAIVVPVNFRLVADEVGFILSDSGARIVVVDEHLAGLVGTNREALPQLEGVVVRGEPSAAGPGAERFSAVMADDPPAPSDDPPAPPEAPVAEHDPALIMYTSGTTGRPKGAVLTHFNLVMSTLGAMITQGIGGYDDVWYANLPLFHIGGLSGILPYIIAGGCSVIVPSGNFDAAEAVRDLVDHGVTGCAFIGMQWDDVCDQVVASGAELRLRRASWGAANTPVPVLEKMSRVLPGVPIATFFGQTEMSPVTCMLSAADAERKRGSVGQPIVNVEARLVDDAGRDVAVGDVGEIVYRGPTVMQGYWNMPEANREAFAGGWFHSGDLCRMDDEGYLYVVDRKLDMIISGGENIYSAEVEAVLRGHPGVADVSLIGVPDDVWGETPRAVVVPADPDRPPPADELMTWCKEHLASYKKPTSVVYVDHLPVNAAGKVLKPALRQRYGKKTQGG